MQVTTCPECETIFKISDEILAKADGQARCGRCGQVFDARVSLREQVEARTRSIYMGDSESRWLFVDPEGEDEAESTSELEVDSTRAFASGTETEFEAEAETESKSDSETETETDADTDTDTDADADAETALTSDPGWLPGLQLASARPRGPYLVGAMLLGFALALQIIHAFRDTLATFPIFGSALAGIYALIGLHGPLLVDLDQYELLDMAALAEPVTDDEGLLIIETRVRNNGPRTQPAPHIFVALLDRWQDTIAGRFFGPDEYAVDSTMDFSAMTSGTSIDAQFVIVDPGPGATGFELQICTPMEQSFACDGDANFN